jgi:hypothetical protein
MRSSGSPGSWPPSAAEFRCVPLTLHPHPETSNLFPEFGSMFMAANRAVLTSHAPARLRIGAPSARAEASAHARSRPACSSRHAARRPAPAPAAPAGLSRSAPNRRGTTSRGKAVQATLGYSKNDHEPAEVAVPGCPGTGRPGKSGASSSPQKPHKAATRRLIPTEIPRTERHTPVHLLCVLKARRLPGDQRGCA